MRAASPKSEKKGVEMPGPGQYYSSRPWSSRTKLSRKFTTTSTDGDDRNSNSYGNLVQVPMMTALGIESSSLQAVQACDAAGAASGARRERLAYALRLRIQ